MIRYATTQQELESAIEARVPGWLQRARTRTQAFRDARRYAEASPIWSEVKLVYMDLQHAKCAYCERKLASGESGGTIEHDLEHFRPKSGVELWPTEQLMQERNIRFTFATGEAFESGYYWLAYHLLNYCTACKQCNTPHKLNFFPIAASRPATPAEPTELFASERPFLIFPLGSLDEDPEDLITFVGINAIPKKKTGPRWRRAKVTIELFNLNGREELRHERAEQLVALDNALAILESNLPEARKEMARQDIRRLRASSTRHASCVRCAIRLYTEQPDRARELFDGARQWLDGLR